MRGVNNGDIENQAVIRVKHRGVLVIDDASMASTEKAKREQRRDSLKSMEIPLSTSARSSSKRRPSGPDADISAESSGNITSSGARREAAQEKKIIVLAEDEVPEAVDVECIGTGLDISNKAEASSYILKAFYCPITKKIMENPVVHPNGASYEEAALADSDDSIICYPNLALRALIQDKTKKSKQPISSHDVSKKAGHHKVRPLQGAFYCPLTRKLFEDPVIDSDGVSYEREAILEWIEDHGTSPTTDKTLVGFELYDNKALLDALLEETEDERLSLHPSVQRWKRKVRSHQLKESANIASELSQSPQHESQPETTRRISMNQGVPELDGLEQRHNAYLQSKWGTWRICICMFCTCYFVAFLLIYLSLAASCGEDQDEYPCV